MLTFDRVFSEAASVSPLVSRNAVITNDKGEEVFRQDGVLFPEDWSDRAVNIVASKYFYGEQGTPEREKSLHQLLDRVVDTITNWGIDLGYFKGSDAISFSKELFHLLRGQYGSFNSPVWFNVGLGQKYGYEEKDRDAWPYKYSPLSFTTDIVEPYFHPQASACFIIEVNDNMESIMQSWIESGRLFKYGSGVGADWSKLRANNGGKLSGGGKPSGPVSFMRVQDKVGGVVKSGGKTRRAAIMQTLRCWHPDIMEFISVKKEEEMKAHALIEQGYDASYNGNAYGSVEFQNVNQTVRVTDYFMQSVTNQGGLDNHYQLLDPVTKEPVQELDARKVLEKMAEGAWFCGDPGIQYEDTIQKWHTCKASGNINSSNPCSEYMFLDNSACNLASLNLVKFFKDGKFDIKLFQHAVDLLITAQDILVSGASYPSVKIAENSYKFRPLGLGYANLGALLMLNGYPYDSDEGRNYAASITALMHGRANLQSCMIAKSLGSFEGFEKNKESILDVLELHADAAMVKATAIKCDIWNAAMEAHEYAITFCAESGIRNSQVTVIAPTGTISFMMDCDTTGIEPELALVKYKLLAGKGDGMIKMVNQTVEDALNNLGYTQDEIAKILAHIQETDTIEGAPCMSSANYSVFDCSFRPAGGTRSIPWEAHLKMMAAVQPFLSGAISKTINMPEDSTVEDIMKAYTMGWELGLKSVAVYRENSKRSQPLSTKKETKTPEIVLTTEPVRKRLPDERQSITHKFSIGGHDCYLHVGLYEDGTPGELFVQMNNTGSSLMGLMDALATQVSISLQYGVPLYKIVEKLRGGTYEPSGFVIHPQFKKAKSITDYIGQWLDWKFLAKEMPKLEVTDPRDYPTPTVNIFQTQPKIELRTERVTGDFCTNCGGLMVQSGSCKTCTSCGNSAGGCG